MPVTAKVAPPVAVLPPSQRRRLEQIRSVMLDDVNKAVAQYAGPLRSEADVLIRQVKAALDLPASIRSDRVRTLISRFYSTSNGRLREYVGELVSDAAGYVDRYEEMLRAYRVKERHRLKDRPGAYDIKAISDYEAYFATAHGAPGAKAATAYASRLARRAAEDDLDKALLLNKHRRRAGHVYDEYQRRKRVRAVTSGDVIAKKHLMRWEKFDLSRALHGHEVASSREATRIVLRSIRESTEIGRAAREMQRLIRAKTGSELAGNAMLPQLVDRLQEAGRALSKHAGDPMARAEWKAIQKEMRRYADRLAQGGTVQNAYLELLQRAKRWGPKQIDRAVDSWSYYKQRYYAEAVLRTETARAYRIGQLEADAGKSWVIGYEWVMARSLHSAYVARKPGRQRKFGGRHCICEVLAGRVLTPDVAMEYGQGGGHPHCMCTLRPIFSRQRMLSADETDAEAAWFEAEFG